MTPPPRAILATDLDGTLLRTDGTVSPKVRSALATAGDHGIEVVFVTGRPPMFLPPVLADTGHQGTVLGANGAVTFDAATRTVTEIRTFDGDAVLGIVSALSRVPGAADVRVMMHHRNQPEHPGVRLLGDFDEVRAAATDLLEAGWECVKIAAVGAPPHTSASFAADAESAIASAQRGSPPAAEVTWSMSTPALVELSPPGVHKGSALAAYAAGREIAKADIYAVGDMPNDLPMFAAAGRAFAVRNAHPSVLAAAHEHLPGNDDDAVAVLLERLIIRSGHCADR